MIYILYAIMKKKIFSLGLWAIFGIALFTLFVAIRNSFTSTTTAQTISNFSGMAARGRWPWTWMMMPGGTGNRDVGVQGIAQKLWISTGELQTQLDNGKTMAEIMKEYGATISWSIQQKPTASWSVMSAKEILNSDSSWMGVPSDVTNP